MLYMYLKNIKHFNFTELQNLHPPKISMYAVCVYLRKTFMCVYDIKYQIAMCLPVQQTKLICTFYEYKKYKYV